MCEVKYGLESLGCCDAMGSRCKKFFGIAVISTACVANGMENKIVVKQTYQDVLKEITELRKELDNVQAQRDLYSEVIKIRERNSGNLRIPGDLYARHYIKPILADVRQSMRDENAKALESKLKLESQIYRNRMSCKALWEIISTSAELKELATKKLIAENSKLRARLYRIEDKINEEKQKSIALQMEYILESSNKQNERLAQQINMYTAKKENDDLQLLLEKRLRQLNDISKKNEEWRSMIYGIANGLL